MDTSQANLTFRSTDPTRPDLVLDLRKAYAAERRIPEVAAVTPAKAPELLATFNEAYNHLGGMFANLELELSRGYNRIDRRRAIVLLDVVPEYVKTKGIGNPRSPMGSEDIREAIINRDDEMADLLDRVAETKAVRELILMKLKSIEMAYNSVKKILGDRNFQFSASFNGQIPDQVEAGQELEDTASGTTVVSQVRGFGKPRY